jgi:hypothetical protein
LGFANFPAIFLSLKSTRKIRNQNNFLKAISNENSRILTLIKNQLHPATKLRPYPKNNKKNSQRLSQEKKNFSIKQTEEIDPNILIIRKHLE